MTKRGRLGLLGPLISQIAVSALLSGCALFGSNDPLEISRFRYPGELELLNRTNGEIRVSAISTNVPALYGESRVIDVNVRLAARERIEIPIGELSSPPWRAITTNIDFSGLVRALNEGMLPRECVPAQLFQVGHPYLIEHELLAGNFVTTLPGTASVEYFRAGNPIP